MDAVTKDKWVAALRSGDYQQGRSRLVHEGRSGKFYCCLGVLCDVLGYKQIDITEYQNDALGFVTPDGKRVEFAIGDERVLTMHHESMLMQQNDGGDSFAQIAQWITDNVETSE